VRLIVLIIFPSLYQEIRQIRIVSSNTQPFGLDCKPTALVIVESHSPTADLLSKKSILLQKVLDDLLLMLVHPASNGNNHKTERMREEYHLIAKSRSYSELLRSSF